MIRDSVPVLVLSLLWLPQMVHSVLLLCSYCFSDTRIKMTGFEEILMHTLTLYCGKPISICSVRQQCNCLQQELSWLSSSIPLQNTHQPPREIAPGRVVLEHCLSRGDPSQVPKYGPLLSCVFLFFLMPDQCFWRQIHLTPCHRLPCQMLRRFDVQNHL